MADNAGQQIKKGDVLFYQGKVPGEIFFLQSGALEILSASDEFNDLDPSIILSKSSRVGMISGKRAVPAFSPDLVKPSMMTVRAIADSQVTRLPVRGGFRTLSGSDPARALTVLKHLYSLKSSFSESINKINKLYGNVSRVNDNISLIYKELSVSGADDKLDINADDLYSEYKSAGGEIPREFTAKFLVADTSRFFSKDYSIDTGDDSADDHDLHMFVKKVLMLDGGIFSAMVKSDPEIGVLMHRTLTGSVIAVLNHIELLYSHVRKVLDKLFGDGVSWTTFLTDKGGFDQWKSTGRLSGDFVKNFLTLIVKINTIYEEVSGRKMTVEYPGLKRIHLYFKSGGKAAPAAAQQDSPASARRTSSPGNIKEVARSMHQIFEFSVIDKEFQERFIKLLNDFKSMKNPFDTETEGRKVRRFITKMYWQLYKQVYIRSKAESNLPIPVRLMLNYGFVDETLLEEDQISDLLELLRIREESKDIPVYYEQDFLSLIHSGKELPSITEMGLTYEAHLREEAKHATRKKQEEMKSDIEDENLKKTVYEIEQRLRSTSAVCSGSTATAFPILNEYAVKGSLKSLYTSKTKVEDIVKKIMEIDFTVFLRETVLKLGEAREIIQEEVLPYFVLLPIFGTRTLLWQELSGIDKRSRGRIVIPIFFMGDLMKSIAHTLACFRWELNRTIKGQAMWADPIEGGITGEYFDYVNTYKKNPNLSMEAKDKITMRFKSLRTNRDRFADDYLLWVLFEKDGIMKMNNIVRGMFFKHIPFRQEIRDRLESMPAFNKFANRYNNVSAKTYQAYLRRYKKYQGSDGRYPPEIEKYLEFLQL